MKSHIRNLSVITLLAGAGVMAFVTLRADQPRHIDRIIIHCSAVAPDQTSSARQIDEWHRAKGWKMIGYHYVIRRDGSIEKGRPEEMVGAHTKGYNGNSIAICYEGGVVKVKELKSERVKEFPEGPDGHSSLLTPHSNEPSAKASSSRQEHKNALSMAARTSLRPADTRTPEQKAAMLALLKHLKKIYPHATIHGHNEFAPKACPCFDVRAEYGGL